jgi:hypothetical protein
MKQAAGVSREEARRRPNDLCNRKGRLTMERTQRRTRRWLGVIRGGRPQVIDLLAYRAAKAAAAGAGPDRSRAA